MPVNHTNKWYHWRHGRTTVLWPIKIFGWWRAVGVIRVHYDKDKIPGPYHCAGTIIVKNGRYEVMGFITRDREAGSTEEFKNFIGTWRVWDSKERELYALRAET